MTRAALALLALALPAAQALWQPLPRELIPVAERLSRSVCKIVVLREGEGAAGSAWAIDERGYLVTARHVVRGAVTVRVHGLELIPAYLTWPEEAGDAPRFAFVVAEDVENDLALLRAVDAGAGRLAKLELAERAPAPGTPLALMGTFRERAGSLLWGEMVGPYKGALFGMTVPGIPGYSGGPVVERASLRVVGVFVKIWADDADHEKDDRGRFFVGAEKVRSLWQASAARVAEAETRVAEPRFARDFLSAYSRAAGAVAERAAKPGPARQ